MAAIKLRQLKTELRTDLISAAGIPLEREMTPLGLRSPVNPSEKTAASCDKEKEPALVQSVHIPTHMGTNAVTPNLFRS
jgi:hypothetical protein